MGNPASKSGALTRRRFLEGAAGAAVAGAAAAATPAASEAGRPNKKYGMLIDTRRCTGCHACTVACKSEFDVPLGVNRSWVEYVDKGTYPDASRSFLPRLCNQCTDPPCVWVCPTDATWKREEDGIVVVDPEICIGCKYCVLACPYDMRFLNPRTGSAEKCDFCVHRVERGLAPSCVNTCEGGARIFGDLDDPESEISRLIAANEVTVLRAELGTGPNVYYIDADHADERDARHRDQHVRVTTHRKQKQRR